MARASVRTKLPLDTWARIMGIQPLHFCGVEHADLAPAGGCAAGPWMQHSWQDNDRVSREEVAEAIAQAEADIEALLHYRLRPAWETDEWHGTIRPYRPEYVNLSVTDVRGFGQTVRANWRHFITGGVEAKELIPNPSAISWDSAYGSAYEERGTVTVTTTVADPCEIAIFYPGKAGADEWEIRPINVSIDMDTGLATITFRREQAVLEELLEVLGAEGVDGSDDDNFLTDVEVYRRYNDPQTQVSFLWEPSGACTCNGASACVGCQYTTQTGCLMVRSDPRLSMVVFRPALWDQDELDFTPQVWALGRQPNLVRLYYLAGLRDKSLDCPSREMPREWQRAVAYYAASLLDRPICECATSVLDKCQKDLAFTTGAEQLASYSIAEGDLNNPLGTTWGALFAWRRVRREAMPDSV